jgi:organic hydroperoxide reductase OsmC/OhrA
MHPFPHLYVASASSATAGDVTLASAGLADLPSDAPAEFGGPGTRWSPETLLIASVADCFVLSFRAVAAASKFPYVSVSANVTGKLEKTPAGMMFTSFDVKAKLVVPAGTDAERAKKLLEKSEQVCLIRNSLKGESHLESEVSFG